MYVAGKPKSETQKRKDKSRAVTQQMMHILSAGQFTDTVKNLDVRFSQSLANFITGDPGILVWVWSAKGSVSGLLPFPALGSGSEAP